MPAATRPRSNRLIRVTLAERNHIAVAGRDERPRILQILVIGPSTISARLARSLRRQPIHIRDIDTGAISARDEAVGLGRQPRTLASIAGREADPTICITRVEMALCRCDGVFRECVC